MEQIVLNVLFFIRISDQIQTETLGSKPLTEVLDAIRPSYWFAAHLHCKYAAIVPHYELGSGEIVGETKFLALGKCLPNMQFLQVLNIATISTDDDEDPAQQLSHDLEWLAILRATNHLMSTSSGRTSWPADLKIEINNDDREKVLQMMNGDLRVSAEQFCRTACEYRGSAEDADHNVPQPRAILNPQTIAFCKALGIVDPVAELLKSF